MSCCGRDAVKNSKAIDEAIEKDKQLYQSTHRLLLLGESFRPRLLGLFGVLDGSRNVPFSLAHACSGGSRGVSKVSIEPPF